MSAHNPAERTRRPFRLFHICLSLFAIVILTACNSNAAKNSLNRNMYANSSAPRAATRAKTPRAATPRAVNVNGDVIDLVSFTKGLDGSFSTARAGQTLLADNGLARPVNGAMSLPTPEPGDYVEPAPSATTSLQVKANATAGLLMTAYGQTGRPYKNGGLNPASGFDAAGFTRWVYGQRGITLPKTAARQAVGGRQIAKEDVRPGDLLVYRDPAAQGSFHVGIYTGKGNFLHAAAKSGVVTETDAFGPQFSPYFVEARRYYDDPKAAPLSDSEKMTAASSAVKTALSELGAEDQPERQAYSKPRKKFSPKAKARRATKRRR